MYYDVACVLSPGWKAGTTSGVTNIIIVQFPDIDNGDAFQLYSFSSQSVYRHDAEDVTDTSYPRVLTKEELESIFVNVIGVHPRQLAWRPL